MKRLSFCLLFPEPGDTSTLRCFVIRWNDTFPNSDMFNVEQLGRFSNGLVGPSRFVVILFERIKPNLIKLSVFHIYLRKMIMWQRNVVS